MSAQPTAQPIGPAFTDTEQRILDAAIACVKQWGIEKTSLGDIAKQAGFTRPTVYRYFASRNEVLSAALLRSARAFARRSLAHIAPWQDPVERYVASVLFALEEFPREPSLSMIIGADLSAYVSQDALRNSEGWALTLWLTRETLRGAPLADAALQEINELTIRFILSMLVMAGPRPRDADEMRGFVRRRLVPMLGLPAVLKPGSPAS